ncbi:hypothetical protein [Streptomyces sp. NPDC093568]|uniref:hypothetical protein n=1 Tax=Streptomyces sp. NPDC093568 TaxID=3366041 RepID=UPI0037F37213
MSAFIQQLPALLGVVIGALGSYLVVVRGDRMRFRREQAARREERRLAAYVDYAQALKRSVTLTYQVAAQLGNDPHPHPLSLQEAEPLFAEAMAARDPAWEVLLLLGSPEVVERARTWVLTLIDMEQFIRRDTCDPATWHALLERQRVSRDGYYTAVRNDLALPPGHPAQWTPPMLRS